VLYFLAGKFAKLSTTFDTYTADYAIDGQYLPSQHGISDYDSLVNTEIELSPWIQIDTEIELSPWIQIDLLTSHFVYGVKIWNRSETPHQGTL